VPDQGEPTPDVFSEAERVAYYGVLFAMAAVDGALDRDELEFIFQLIELDDLSEANRSAVLSYVATPPAVIESLEPLSECSEELRCLVMLQLFQLAYRDNEVHPEEEQMLTTARERLRIPVAQFDAMRSYTKRVRAINDDKTLSDDAAERAFKEAVSALTGAGVPLAAIYISGSVIGFSAAGITSGLAALGLGFGMVPGIGVAIIIGITSYVGLRRILGRKERQRDQAARLAQERRAQKVIENMQAAIQDLMKRIADLQQVASETEANRRTIEELLARLRAMKQLVTAREAKVRALEP